MRNLGVLEGRQLNIPFFLGCMALDRELHVARDIRVGRLVDRAGCIKSKPYGIPGYSNKLPGPPPLNASPCYATKLPSSSCLPIIMLQRRPLPLSVQTPDTGCALSPRVLS